MTRQTNGSDTIQDSTSEYSTSSESETDEEDLTEATTSSGGRERSKPAEGNATAKTTRPQKKSKVTALDSKEIEDLASWIFFFRWSKESGTTYKIVFAKWSSRRVSIRTQAICQTFVMRRWRVKLWTAGDKVLSKVFNLGTGIFRE